MKERVTRLPFGRCGVRRGGQLPAMFGRTAQFNRYTSLEPALAARAAAAAHSSYQALRLGLYALYC